MNIRFKFVLLIFGFSVVSTSADAGIFGPSNANECVLEKMKGQDRAMIGTARAACAEQFPEETPLQEGMHYRKGQIAYSWCDTEDDLVVICLDTNDSPYKITKAVLTLYDTSCDKENGNSVQVDVLPAMYGNKFKARLQNARTYKCMNAAWYGIKKK